MRISDWSSDVCSSDSVGHGRGPTAGLFRLGGSIGGARPGRRAADRQHQQRPEPRGPGHLPREGRLMRFRLPLGRRLFVLCAILFALLALFPLRLALAWLALDERGFAAREAKGSLWLGAHRKTQFGAVELGALQARHRKQPRSVDRVRMELTNAGD